MTQTLSYNVSGAEGAVLARVCDRVVELSPERTPTGFVHGLSLVASEARETLVTLTTVLSKLSSRHDSPGVVLLVDLPVLPEPRVLPLLVATLLGKPIRFEGEGDFLIEIREEPLAKDARPSFRNTQEFFPHTDLSYSEVPPPFLIMHSLANSPEDGGISEFTHIDEIIGDLDAGVISELQKAQFLFPAPPHYRGPSVVQFPILTSAAPGNPPYWMGRFRRDNLRSLTRVGIEAIVELVQAIERRTFEMMLYARTLVVFDNYRVLHGRTAYMGGHLARTVRHLNRVFAADLQLAKGFS